MAFTSALKLLKRSGSAIYHRLYVRAFLAEFISTFAILVSKFLKNKILVSHIVCACFLTLFKCYLNFRKAFVNGLIAQAVLTDGEKGNGVAPKWGAFVAAMSGILIACGASGTNEIMFYQYQNLQFPRQFFSTKIRCTF